MIGPHRIRIVEIQITNRGLNVTTEAAGRVFIGVIDSALEAVRAASVATQKAEQQIEAFATFAKSDPNTDDQASAPKLST